MKKQLIKIQFSLARTYESTLKLIYLHKLFFINSKISQSTEILCFLNSIYIINLTNKPNLYYNATSFRA